MRFSMWQALKRAMYSTRIEPDYTCLRPDEPCQRSECGRALLGKLSNAISAWQADVGNEPLRIWLDVPARARIGETFEAALRVQNRSKTDYDDLSFQISLSCEANENWQPLLAMTDRVRIGRLLAGGAAGARFEIMALILGMQCEVLELRSRQPSDGLPVLRARVDVLVEERDGVGNDQKEADI